MVRYKDWTDNEWKSSQKKTSERTLEMRSGLRLLHSTVYWRAEMKWSSLASWTGPVFFLREHFTALSVYRWFKVAIDKFSAFKLVPYELHFHSVALSATEYEIYRGKWRLNLWHKIIWLQSVPERLITRASCWFSHEQVPATTVVFHFCFQKNKNMTPTFLKSFLSACRLHKMQPSAMLLEVAPFRKQECDPVSRSTSPATRSIALFTYTATV